MEATINKQAAQQEADRLNSATSNDVVFSGGFAYIGCDWRLENPVATMSMKTGEVKAYEWQVAIVGRTGPLPRDYDLYGLKRVARAATQAEIETLQTAAIAKMAADQQERIERSDAADAVRNGGNWED